MHQQSMHQRIADAVQQGTNGRLLPNHAWY
jgi:hypothetical protein